ncbi:SDR family oxidoreductase [Leucothrix mucor]|uniref:SDR family oxidoreductase n=1 Tax=Leucothrix mucor TaxID=45248 RepID=UPI0003B70DDF|nr:SDR family oxidoreductase [Leucothrix mucor]
MIAITGATGKLGRLVIESLLSKTEASNLVALVRNPQAADDLKALGLQVRQADYDKPETFTTALEGVSKLLLISGSEVGKRAQQHQAVIDAAKAAKLELFVYTSLLHADTSKMMLADEHKVTEAAIKATELPAVILRNGWYTENYVESVGGVLHAGAVAGAAKDGVMNTAARKDYAEAAAVVLTAAQPEIGRVYELAGDEGFTLAQYAAEIAKQTGKTINYAPMSQTEFNDMLVGVGLPEGLAAMLADSEANAAEGSLADNSGDLSALIGRPTTPLAETLAAALNAQ